MNGGVHVNQLELFHEKDLDPYIVRKSTGLIREAKHSLSAKELTLIDYLISQVKQHDSELYEIEVSIKELNEICKFGSGGAAYSSTMEALLTLANKGFWFEMSNGTKTIGRWLDKAYVKNGIARLQLDKDLSPHLLGLVRSGNYTQFYFADVVNLKSLFAKRLYEELRSYNDENTVELSVERIKELFNKENLEWSRVQAYLRKAKKNINENTFMTIDYETVRKGRKTVSVRFHVTKKKGDLLEG
ncbi:RepB family plasmid replication initiator protein [Enterococcus faecalis]|nr:initiator RepB protein [Enterococcus faecalis 20.SD.W.06]MBJ0422329.1 replication initiation protein [Enterococcus faecalis]NAA43428.1 RepB family plasmid replication initiator protein [Enterococcus faecalis]NAA62327.1 RepB family plasmid replication initiator protein [Enterococcus faecalis]NAB66175.1 RepB family plasmid replication initiator protein [Enterococcus faecalis]